MIETGLLAAAGTLVLTLLLGFLISLFFRTRTAEKQLHLGVSASIIGPWLVGLFVVLLALIWKLIGKVG